MADNKTAFIQRVVSSALAGFGLLALGVYGGTLGLQFACTAAVVLGTREYARIAFRHWKLPVIAEHAFWLVAMATYVALFRLQAPLLPVFAVANTVFLVLTLWLARNKVTNEQLLAALGVGSFGLTYCVVFPFYATSLVALNKGSQWFLLLLLVVFAGDTFAYFGGRFFGRHKMLVQISPNKTWEGAVAGLLGSSVVGMIHLATVFADVPWYSGLLFCVICGVAAQSGDLLMSLVKRVAQVKDSGHIMPGHGGVLDRLDGVFIASPLVYAFALYVTTHASA